MKTLTMLGVMFLPGAFLSSIFGMPFFDFSDDIRNSVSPRLYVFFVIFVPLTIIILVFWWKFDEYSTAQADTKVSDSEMDELEEQIMDALRNRINTRVGTNPASARLGGTGLSKEKPVSQEVSTGFSSFPWRMAGILSVGKFFRANRLPAENEGQELGGRTGTTGRDIELGHPPANGLEVPNRVSWGPNRHI